MLPTYVKPLSGGSVFPWLTADRIVATSSTSTLETPSSISTDQSIAQTGSATLTVAGLLTAQSGLTVSSAVTVSLLTADRVVTTNSASVLSAPASVTTSQAWSFTSTLTAVDANFSITGSSDATKTIRFEADAQSAGADLTINSGAQTADRTLSVPVLTGNATLMVLSETQTVTGNKSFTGTMSVVDGNFSVVGSGDSTKTIKFEVDAQTTADDLTINSGAQTDDRTVSFPVLTANATLMVLSEAQTVTGVKTFDADIAMATNRNVRTATNADYLSLIGGVTLTSDPGFQIFGSAYGSGISGFMYLDCARFILRGINGATNGVVDIVGTTAATAPNNAALIVAGGIGCGNIWINSATLISTSTSFTNGAAAQVGTLTNAPTAGNPTKWVPINDNGTTRYIPCW